MARGQVDNNSKYCSFCGLLIPEDITDPESLLLLQEIDIGNVHAMCASTRPTVLDLRPNPQIVQALALIMVRTRRAIMTELNSRGYYQNRKDKVKALTAAQFRSWYRKHDPDSQRGYLT